LKSKNKEFAAFLIDTQKNNVEAKKYDIYSLLIMPGIYNKIIK
jgi:hypothetical protein